MKNMLALIVGGIAVLSALALAPAAEAHNNHSGISHLSHLGVSVGPSIHRPAVPAMRFNH